MNLSLQSYYFIALTAILLVLIFFFFRTLKMLRKKKIWASCRNSSYLLLLLFFLISTSLVGTNVLTYHRLTHETPIASLQVERLKKQSYQLELLLFDNCSKTSYSLKGDEWQMDARIIKWYGWANLLGLDASFQLDRLSGRYQNIDQQRMNLPTVFAIEAKPEYDLWKLKKDHQWLPWLDAEYGQSVFLTMKDNQSYQLYMTQTGIIAREEKSGFPENKKCSF